MAKNPFLLQFHSDLRARYPVDGVDMGYAAWVAANTKIHGRPFTYAGYEFQSAIIDDMSPDLSVIKPSQVGMTEVQIRKFLAFLARNRGTSGMFTFPNEKMFKINSKTQPAFSSSILEDEKPQRAMNLYEVCGSFAHITGMTEGDATSTPADILFHDEVDLSDQGMIGLYQSRLQNSDSKITQKFSTPTHPGFGIDAAYTASDQREYQVKCVACRHWQVPLFEMKFLCLPGYDGDGDLEALDADVVSQLDLKGSYFKCEKCSARLYLRDPSLREWIAAFPARRGRGYRIRPTSSYRLDPEYIVSQLLKMKQLDNVKGWRNTVLGETYSDGSSKLEPDVVRQVMKGPTVPDVGQARVALGCDMGKTCHLTLGTIRDGEIDPFKFEQVPSSQIVDRVLELCKQYNIVTGAMDRHPYTPTVEQIRELTKRVILPVEYRGQAHINLVEDEWGNLDYVQINRTKAIDNQVKAIQHKATELRGYGGLGGILVEQLCDMVRIETDEKPATWEKLTGNDHFMHSLVLMRASIKIRDVMMLKSNVETRSSFGFAVTNAQPFAPLGMPQMDRSVIRNI
jgi:hypothetical protein